MIAHDSQQIKQSDEIPRFLTSDNKQKFGLSYIVSKLELSIEFSCSNNAFIYDESTILRKT